MPTKLFHDGGMPRLITSAGITATNATADSAHQTPATNRSRTPTRRRHHRALTVDTIADTIPAIAHPTGTITAITVADVHAHPHRLKTTRPPLHQPLNRNTTLTQGAATCHSCTTHRPPQPVHFPPGFSQQPQRESAGRSNVPSHSYIAQILIDSHLDLTCTTFNNHTHRHRAVVEGPRKAGST